MINGRHGPSHCGVRRADRELHSECEKAKDEMKHELSKAVDELLTGTLPPAFPVDGAPYPPTISDDAVRLE